MQAHAELEQFPERLSELLRTVRATVANLPFFGGVRGLTLRLDILGHLGADPSFLEWWRAGRPLHAAGAVPRRFKNHPSLVQHSEWAEAEWNRFEALRKIIFFAPSDGPPPGLHVNPCALLLKPRKGVADDAPEKDKYKARLLMDLKLGGINARLPHWDVNYGTTDLALSRMQKGLTYLS